MNNKYIIMSLLLLFFNQAVFSRTVGSNTAVSREPQASFSVADTNNLILGFARMENGVLFEGANLSCAVDVLFPMSGNFVFNNNGTLTLNNNVSLTGSLNLSSGIINGNGYNITFPANQNLVELPSAIYARDIDPQTFIGINSTISLSWSFDNQYLVVVRNGSDTNRLLVYSYDGSSLTNRFTGVYSTNDFPQYVSWHPSEYYFVSSRFNSIDLFSFNPINNNVVVTSQQVIPVSDASPWSPDGNYVLFHGGANVFIFQINNGIIGTTFTLPIHNNRSPRAGDSICWNSDGTRFAVGVFSFENSAFQSYLQIYAFDGSAITYQTEIAAINFTTSLGVAWQPNEQVIVTTASQAFGGTPTNYWKLFKYDELNNSLSEISNAIEPEQVPLNGVHWSSSGNYLSSLRNTNLDLQIFTYNKKKNKLEVVGIRDFSEAHTRFAWSPNEEYFGVLSSNLLTPFNFEKKHLLFQNANLTLNSDTVFTTTVEFEGECSINANNYEIDLSQGFIKLSNDSTLNIENTIINGIQNNNIFCSNNAGVLNLKNIEWNLMNDYTFTIGALSIQDKFKINSNQSSFTYSSDQNSKVQEYTEFILGVNTRFSYAPSIANKGLFQLESDSSILTLESGSTLHSTSTGLRFENGVIRVSGSSVIKNDGTVEAESIDLSAVVLEWLTGGVLSIEGQVKI